MYMYKCDRVECNENNIGESLRNFWHRVKEYHRALSPIYHHANITGHPTSLGNFTTVTRESYNFTRTIKEMIYIRVNDPFLNRNIGKYQLSHTWD